MDQSVNVYHRPNWKKGFGQDVARDRLTDCQAYSELQLNWNTDIAVACRNTNTRMQHKGDFILSQQNKKKTLGQSVEEIRLGRSTKRRGTMRAKEGRRMKDHVDTEVEGNSNAHCRVRRPDIYVESAEHSES